MSFDANNAPLKTRRQILAGAAVLALPAATVAASVVPRGDTSGRRIPDDVRQRMPEVQWKMIAGMRDWMIHASFAISNDIVWDAIETKVPQLLRTLQTFKDENQQ